MSMVVGVATILYAASPAPASFATYPVTVCNDAPAGANNAWSERRTAVLTQLETVAVCPSGAPDPYASLRNGIGVVDVVNAWDEGTADGSYVEWQLAAPPGTGVVAASISRDLGNRDEWTPYGRIDGVDQPGESCMRGTNQSFCRIQGTRMFTDLNARSIAYGVRCVIQPYCAHGATLRSVWALVLGATVTIDDRQVPTVSAVEPSGLADGRWWNGGGTLAFSAADNTGVRRRGVVVDGGQRGWVDAPGASVGGCRDVGLGVAYTYTRPCADSRGLNGLRSVIVEPCGWGDGAHAVRGAATDTGGLQAVSGSAVTVRVDCTAPDVDVVVGAAEVLAGEPLEPVVTVSDGASGVRETEVELSVDGGVWSPYGGGVVAEGGRSYRFRARAVDAAGNESEWVEGAEVLGVAPVAQPEPDEPGPEEEPAPWAPVQPPAVPVVPGAPSVPAPASAAAALVVPDAGAGEAAPRPGGGQIVPEPPPPITVELRDPRLRIARVTRRGRALIVSGTTARGLAGRVVVRVAKRAKRAAVHNGRWRVRVHIGRGRPVRRVAVELPQTGGFRAARAIWPRKPLQPLR